MTKPSQNQNTKIITFKIYFRRKNIKFLVEIWRFVINYSNSDNKNLNYRQIFLYKKLSVMIRTLQSLNKFLPLHSLLINGFGYTIEYELEDLSQNENDFIQIKKNVFKKMIFANYSDNIGEIKYEVLYMNKNDIFLTEDEEVKNNI